MRQSGSFAIKQVKSRLGFLNRQTNIPQAVINVKDLFTERKLSLALFRYVRLSEWYSHVPQTLETGINNKRGESKGV